MKMRSGLVAVALTLLAAGSDATAFQLRMPFGLQEQAAYIPEDNPLTPEKIALGKQLFWDKRWSRNGTVACVTCHDPGHG
jgi:cytochrome c peroxidase